MADPLKSNSNKQRPFKGHAAGLVAMMLGSIALSSCESYGLDDAALEQRQFNEAFRQSQGEQMKAASESFRTNFAAEKFKGSAGSACARVALFNLEEDVPKLQGHAVTWSGDKSADKALKIWKRLEEFGELRDKNYQGCSETDLKALSELRELERLLRLDIEQVHDMEALLAADKAKQDELLAKRLASCDLEEWRQRLVFRQFIWGEDIHGLDGRQTVISDVAMQYGISGDCVERTVRNATIDHPEWIPEPL